MSSVKNKTDAPADVADGRRVKLSNVIMNEKVQNLAGLVYEEFEKMIANYDANVVRQLAPVVVNMLECLQSAYTKNDELEIQIEMLTEDVEQLEIQYQKEKILRMGADERHIELEDTLVENLKDSDAKLKCLNSVIKTYEMKTNELTNQFSSLKEQNSLFG